MEHITDIQLLDYVAGRLPTAQASQLSRHIADCSDCAGRYREALATWDALGEWQVDPSAHQVADGIEALATQAGPQRQPRPKVLIPLRYSLGAALRIAAAILIAISGGHLLGRFSAASSEPIAVISTEKPRYLAALGFEWSNELTWTVLEEETPSGANP